MKSLYEEQWIQSEINAPEGVSSIVCEEFAITTQKIITEKQG